MHVKPVILIVDDSQTVRALYTELLTRSGFEVKVARDGLEAWDIIQHHPPQLVLMDIVMPRMNGYELCRKLRDNPVTQDMPVVMVSSKDQEFDRYWGLKQGANAYITRPCRPDDLVRTINELLQQSQRSMSQVDRA
ncbi:MAG: response regulator [Cyanobacteria bacterium]|nr:response regulator [Cyanobacteriota bacterium]MDW8203121.1 response regulator [Cyanobacteriota bacterium SKYGB_h_bin112]